MPVGIETAPTTPGTLAMTHGTTHTVTLSLARPAPAGGVCVSLSSSAPGVATVPPPVCIDAGQSTFSFLVTAVAAGEASITAVAGDEIFAFTVAVDQAAPVRGEFFAAPVGACVKPSSRCP